MAQQAAQQLVDIGRLVEQVTNVVGRFDRFEKTVGDSFNRFDERQRLMSEGYARREDVARVANDLNGLATVLRDSISKVATDNVAALQQAQQSFQTSLSAAQSSLQGAINTANANASAALLKAETAHTRIDGLSRWERIIGAVLVLLVGAGIAAAVALPRALATPSVYSAPRAP